MLLKEIQFINILNQYIVIIIIIQTAVTIRRIIIEQAAFESQGRWWLDKIRN